MRHDFHRLEVVAVRRETPDALSFALAVPPALAGTFRYKPGQHVPVRAGIGGEEVRRTYSISSGPTDEALWITIKRVPGGLFSTWAHETLKPGATLECMPPAGRLVIPVASADMPPRRVVAIVAGSGITPVISILEHGLAAEPDSRFTLIYGNRTVDGIVFRERLEELKNRHLARLQILHVLSRDAEADVPLLAGRIDTEKLGRLLGTCGLAPGDHVLLCGPGTLISDARAVVSGLGVTRDHIHFEYFRAGPDTGERPSVRAPAVATPAPVAGAEAIAVLDGVRRSFPVPEGSRVIDAALAAGIRLPYSCKGGMCCTCRARLVEGAVTMDRNFSLQRWEIEAGFVLTCQSRPTTPRVVLDYDEA